MLSTELKEDATNEEINEQIDTMSPEQVEEMIENGEIEAIEPVIKEEKEPVIEPDKGEPVIEDNQKEEQPVKESEEDEPNKVVLIDDEYIKGADEKDRKVLESIKGESLSKKMLKKHISAEHGIATMKGEKGEAISKLDLLKKDFEESRKVNEPVAKATPEKLEKIDKLVMDRMKAKFSDFPETEEAMNELGYENSTKAFKYMNAEKEERAFVQKRVDKVEHYQKNSREINSAVLESDINLIKSELDKVGLKPEDLGITLEFTDKGDFKDEALDKLFLNKDGAFDAELVDTTFGVPIIKEKAYAKKFQSQFYNKIFEAIKNKALVEGASAKTKTKKVTETMSQMKPGSQTQFKDAEDKISNMSETEINAELERTS